ncbi:hypothetical protein C8J57DRAFT_1718403 [Mycena rebaudengoi]|nr:hypothetical protein C8J57DRAFT_1718403 [Mycena rebaudengoi]
MAHGRPFRTNFDRLFEQAVDHATQRGEYLATLAEEYRAYLAHTGTEPPQLDSDEDWEDSDPATSRQPSPLSSHSALSTTSSRSTSPSPSSCPSSTGSDSDEPQMPALIGRTRRRRLHHPAFQGIHQRHRNQAVIARRKERRKARCQSRYAHRSGVRRAIFEPMGGRGGYCLRVVTGLTFGGGQERRENVPHNCQNGRMAQLLLDENIHRIESSSIQTGGRYIMFRALPVTDGPGGANVNHIVAGYPNGYQRIDNLRRYGMNIKHGDFKSAAIKGVRTPQVQEWLSLSRAPPTEARRQLLERVIARSKERAERQARVDALVRMRNAPRSRGLLYYRLTAVARTPSSEKPAGISKEEQAVLKLVEEERAERKAKLDALDKLRTANEVRWFGSYYVMAKKK